jgi:HlyD family secretion protein
MKTYIVKSLFIASALSLVACKNDNPDQLTEGKTKKEIVSFAPKVTGRILKIYVEEGQTVKAGDTLAMLDVPEVSAKIAQAKGATAAATAQAQMAKNGATADQLRQLKAKQKGLAEQFEFAQKSYKRASNMFKDSLMSPQNYDEILQNIKVQKLN